MLWVAKEIRITWIGITRRVHMTWAGTLQTYRHMDRPQDPVLRAQVDLALQIKEADRGLLVDEEMYHQPVRTTCIINIDKAET